MEHVPIDDRRFWVVEFLHGKMGTSNGYFEVSHGKFSIVSGHYEAVKAVQVAYYTSSLQ